MMTGHPYPPPQDVQEDYSKAWQEFEPSLNGSITPSQFRQLMAGLGDPVTDVEVEQLINNVDGEGKLSCEFIVYLGQLKSALPLSETNLIPLDKEFVHFVNNRNAVDDIVSGYE